MLSGFIAEVSSQDTCRSLLTGILEEPTGVCSGPLLGERLTELLHQRQAEEPAFADSTAVIQQTIRVEEPGAVGWGTQCVEGEEAEEGPRRVTFRELEALVDTAAARLQMQLADLPFSRDLAKLTDCAELSSERRAHIERLQERSLVIVCMPACLGRVVIQTVLAVTGSFLISIRANSSETHPIICSFLSNMKTSLRLTFSDTVIGVGQPENSLACMKLRLAYAPVDRHFPKNQITRILQEFAPVACIVEEDSDDGSLFFSNQSTGTAKLISSSELINWEYVERLRQGSQCHEVQSCRALLSTVTDPVILVLFTSGSTSPTPKGVALRNRQLMNRLDWQWSPASPLAGLTGPSLAKTSWLFVDGFTEVFGALLAGRPILLPLSPRGHLSTVQMFTDAALLASVVRKFAIVQLTVVPEQLQSWLVQIEAPAPTAAAAAAGVADCDLIGHFSSLEVLVVSGQLLPVRLAADVFRVFSGGRLRLINLYGSTEVAGDVTAEVFESLEEVLASREKATLAEVDDAFFLPVGLPIKNCEVYVLARRSEEDECSELQVLSRGETGEVYVSGAAVPTSGKIYAEPVKSSNVPEEEEEAANSWTLPNVFSSKSGFQFLFRTGDLGFVSPSNGQLYVCGRCDDTVKVNGVKCNLAAIDTFLAGVTDDVMSNPNSQYRRFATLRATVTQLIDSDRRKAQLVCFYTRKDGISEETVGERFTGLDLARLIGGNLPSFVNVKVVQVPIFPTKPISAKVDKAKLKANYLSGAFDRAALEITNQQQFPVNESTVGYLSDRERARAIFARVLGLETANQNATRLMDDEDFSQLGGDSMTAMLIVSELRRGGIPGNIMHFAGSGRIGTILDHLTQSKETENVLVDNKQSGTFVFEWYPSGAESVSNDHVFNRECKELVVQMLASSFYKLEPISRCLHFSEEALRLHVEAQLRPDCPNRAIVLLAGFLPNQTLAAESNCPHSLLQYAQMSMLLLQPSPLEEPKRPTGMEEDENLPPGLFEFFDDLSASGHTSIDRMCTINCHMLGVRTDKVLSTDASIRLGTLLEKEAMKTAKRMGYKFVDTVNTNQLTQDICENLGYELMNQADFVAYAKDRCIPCDPSVGCSGCQILVTMNKRDEKKILTLFSEIKKIKSQASVDVPVWTKDELLLKLQELYSAVILLDPVLAVAQKFEVELWNSVFRQPVQWYQEILRQKLAGTTKTNCRSSSEIQHRLTPLLERASGFYNSLIHKLLCKLPNESWPKLFISELYQGKTRISMANHKSHLGAGRLDLDEVTLRMQLLRSSIRASRSGRRLVDLDKLGDHNGTPTPSVARTILSRGTQLPDADVLIDLNPQESEFGKSNTVDANTATSEVSPSKPISNISLSEAIVYVIQHSLIHLGDVARYQNHPPIAWTYYTWAWLVDPTSGHPYNQLAILESVKSVFTVNCTPSSMCLMLLAIAGWEPAYVCLVKASSELELLKKVDFCRASVQPGH
ncbi:hypothetical protein SprV_0301015200 [Sparganum proliferum]